MARSCYLTMQTWILVNTRGYQSLLDILH